MRKRLISVYIVAILVFAFHRYALTVGETFVPESPSVDGTVNAEPHDLTGKNMDEVRLDIVTEDDILGGNTGDTTRNSQGIPGITIASPYSISVCIQNKAEYETFISRLAQYSDCTILWMDLSGTNTIVYMDEILKYDNFEYVHIKNGGIISVRDMDRFRCTLSGIELEYVSVIKEGVLSHITFDHESGEDQILVTLNNHYLGKPPTGEVLNDVDCTNVKLEWNGNAKGSGLLEGQEDMENLKEWDYLRSMQEREEQNYDIYIRGCLKALYRYNYGDYSYTSYEFYRNYKNWVEFNDGFICIKDRETDGEDYFDMMDVPEIRDRFLLGTLFVDQRFCISEDVNFDGYRDLIFWRSHTDSYDSCILFLWDETNQRFVFSESAPECISYVDEERERLIFVTGTGQDYFIYEADGNAFTEKRLQIIYDNAVGNHIVLRYYVDDELIAKVMEDEDNPDHYIYEEIDEVREEIEAETLAQAVEIYFPEFDFYPAKDVESESEKIPITAEEQEQIELSAEEKSEVLQELLGTYTIVEFLPTKFYPAPDSAGDSYLPEEEAELMIGKEITVEEGRILMYAIGEYSLLEKNG